MNLKQQIVKGTIWTVVGQVGYMLVSLVTNMVLARLLTPYEFGQMGILVFFVFLANILAESGFGGALVRKKDVTEIDYSTVFVFSLVMSAFCYLLLAILSNSIANYYSDHSLKRLLLVIGVVFLVNSFGIAHNIKLIIELKFKQKNIILFISNLIASVVAIIFAYRGWGIWSLIAYQLLAQLLATIFLISYVPLNLSFRFDRKIFKELYSFGVNTTLTSFISTSFDNIYQLIIGRFFSVAKAGLYYQGRRLQLIPYTIVNAVVQNVFYSALAKLQNDKTKFRESYNRLFAVYSIFLAFITSFICTYAELLIGLFFGDNWKDAALYMQLSAITSFFYFQELFNNIIFKTFNQTRQILHLEILKKTIQVVSIIFGLYHKSIYVLLIGFNLTSAISYFLNFYYSSDLLESTERRALYNIGKIILVSTICIFFTRCIIKYWMFSTFEIIATTPVFLMLFALLILVFKIFSIVEIRKFFSIVRYPKIKI